MNIYFPVFFCVTRDLIDHFGEEIVWLPFYAEGTVIQSTAKMVPSQAGHPHAEAIPERHIWF